MKWQLSIVKNAGKIMVCNNYCSNVLVGIIAAICSGDIIGAADFSFSNRCLTIRPFPLDLIRDDFALALDCRKLIIMIMIYTLLRVCILNPVFVWTRGYYMHMTDRENAHIVVPVDRKSYCNTVKTMLLADLICILHMALLVVPGVVKRYSLFAVPYILADNPMTDCQEALAKSEKMMTGNKMGIFKLELSFAGWVVMGMLSLGLINIFFTNPYMYYAETMAYKQISLESRVE